MPLSLGVLLLWAGLDNAKSTISSRKDRKDRAVLACQQVDTAHSTPDAGSGALSLRTYVLWQNLSMSFIFLRSGGLGLRPEPCEYTCADYLV